MRTLVYLLLLLVVGASGPMAHATPVDQTWIGGLYDNADGDASILALTSLACAVDVIVVRRPAPVMPSRPRTQPDDDRDVTPDVRAGLQNRAPPAA